MDTQKRNKVLLAFGGLAIVLVAVFLVYQPSFPPGNATGAIGAVEKHRAPQINQSDVILGDESTRKDAAVVYADYLNDAVKLQSFSADIAAMSRDTAGVKADVAGALGAHADELSSRYQAQLGAMLTQLGQRANADVTTLAAKDLVGVRDQINALSRMEAKSYDVASMTKINGELGSIVKTLSSATRNPDASEAALGSMLKPMQAKSDVSVNELNVAASRLEALARDLRSADIGVGLEQRYQYMSRLALEAKVLTQARADLAAHMQDAMGSKLVAMEAVSKNLAAHADILEAAAAQGLNSRLEQDVAFASRLSRDEALAGSFQKLGSLSRDASSIGVFTQSLGVLTQVLNGRSAELAARCAPEIEAQLGSLSQYFNARADLAARSDVAGNKTAVEARAAALEAHTDVASRTQAASRTQDLAARADIASFTKYLAAVDREIGAKAALGSLMREQNLGAKADQIGVRVNELGSKYDVALGAKENALGVAQRDTLGSQSKALESRQQTQ